MKITRSWLADWVKTNLDDDSLAERLTLAGHEVDSMERTGAGLESFKIALIQTVEPHPNADKLRVCQVSTADGEPLQIV
ncbi:MAG: hypothetical protein AAF385_06570, partial [Pseudomonadota bacterium]